jgi:hypothetical protein
LFTTQLQQLLDAASERKKYLKTWTKRIGLPAARVRSPWLSKTRGRERPERGDGQRPRRRRCRPSWDAIMRRWVSGLTGEDGREGRRHDKGSPATNRTEPKRTNNKRFLLFWLQPP